ncbi:MAG: ATP-binding protein, partial [Bacteroidota bacterium]
ISYLLLEGPYIEAVFFIMAQSSASSSGSILDQRLKARRRIALWLTLIFVLPIILYSIYAVRKLNREDSMLQGIYERQLEAVLFSVNQYADDLSRSWITELEPRLRRGNDSLLYDFLDQTPSVEAILFGPAPLPRARVVLPEGQDSLWTLYQTALDAALEDTLRTRQLQEYLKKGFQRLEPSRIGDKNAQQVLLLMAREPQGHPASFVGLVVDVQALVNELLAPKLLQIAREDFVLAVQAPERQNILFSTQSLDSVGIQSWSEVWILPKYRLGIAQQGQTLENLVQDRFANDLLVLLLIAIVLILGVLWVFRNLSREVQLAQHKAEFVANVSHEIRTPLALISMFAETLEMGRATTEKKKQEYYHQISRETQRLTTMVDKILNFSRMEGGQHQFQKESTHLNLVVENVMDTYRFHLQQKGVTCETDLQDELPWLQGDQSAITEALINLLDNGIKYGGDWLCIRTGKSEKQVWMEVEDKGPGISDDDQKRIFEKFYRVSAEGNFPVRGTGLGLSLVSHIMEAHDGEVELESKVGKGSRFRLIFPCPEAVEG